MTMSCTTVAFQLPSHTSNLTDRHRGAAPAQAAAGTRAGPVECVAIDTLGSLLGLKNA